MIQITFDVSGIATVQQKFATYGADVKDLSVPFTEIADDLQADFTLNMATEGALFGGGWAPLAPSTIADRVRKGYGAGPILYRTGALANSLSGDNSGAIKEVTPASVTVGTAVPYAGYHQTGTKKMPMRRIIGLSWARRSLIVRRLADYIRMLAAESGIG
jgi:phage gpG-like protein